MNKTIIEVQDEWAVQNEIAGKVIELSGTDIFEKTRKREVVEIRSLFFFILKDKLNMSWTQIANYFKAKGIYINHATVIHSYNNYEMYKSSNNQMQEIQEMISLKTSMDLKGINKEEYLTLKCKDLEQELDKIKNDSILYKLLNQIPKDKEKEAIMRIELLIKGWEWQYKDSTTAYAGE